MEAAIQRQKIQRLYLTHLHLIPRGVLDSFREPFVRRVKILELQFSFFGRQAEHFSHLFPTVDLVFVLKISVKFVIQTIGTLYFEFILIIVT